MNGRDFEALAALVADVQSWGGAIKAEGLARRLADICAAGNRRFERQAFMAAARPRVWRGGRWVVRARRQS
jgi:hypothetical protein